MKKKKKPTKQVPKFVERHIDIVVPITQADLDAAKERDRVIAALIDTGASVKVIETAMIDHTQFLHRLR